LHLEKYTEHHDKQFEIQWLVDYSWNIMFVHSTEFLHIYEAIQERGE
jgi:hypothetical protein